MKTRKPKFNRRASPPVDPDAVPRPAMSNRATLEWIRQDLYASSMITLPWVVEISLSGDAGKVTSEVYVNACCREEAIFKAGLRWGPALDAQDRALPIQVTCHRREMEKETKTGAKTGGKP